MKFRKKPVVIEAEQWFPGVPVPGVTEFVDYTVFRDGQVLGRIDTLERKGDIVSPGYWIITGVKGERYGCDPEIFALTYDKIE